MKKLLISVLLILFSLPLFAQHKHSYQQGITPTEVGQSNFAAVAEIVEILRNDKKTNWDSVDIDALREHLVDMNNLMNHSRASTITSNEAITFEVSGESNTIDSIQRMVLAHAPMLANETGWKINTQKTNNGANISIQSEDMSLVKGLGFYGIMTIGAHHQAHHLMIATGSNPH